MRKLTILTLFLASATWASQPMSLRLPAEAPAPVRDVQDRIYRAAEKQAHYLLGTVQPWKQDRAVRLLTESRSGEHWIRPNTGASARRPARRIRTTPRCHRLRG